MYIWQTKEWWEMLEKSNQVDKIIHFEWIQIEKRKVSLWEYWLFIQWLDYQEILKKDRENIQKFLIEICKKENALFLQIEIIDYENNNNTKEIFSKFKKWAYKKFIPSYTVTIDLTQTEDEILSKMKPKWRYNIKVANKKWVVVKRVEKTDENIKLFHWIITETGSRDNFNTNTLEYYKTFLKTIKSAEMFFAYKDEELISAWIFTFDKDLAIYYYWASTSDKEYRNLMAPYLVQWEAIKEAKKQDCKIYDFLWISSPKDKNSNLKWVTDFKMKFNPNSTKVSRSYIWINKNIKYTIIVFLRKILKKDNI